MNQRVKNVLWVSVVLAAAACAPTTLPPAVVPMGLQSADPAQPRSQVVVDTARKSVVVLVGPFHVPAAQPEAAEHSHDDAEAERPLVEFTWPVPGWLRGFRMTLQDQDGHELPRDLMHHFIAYNLDRRQLVHDGVERLFGAGRETGDLVAPGAVGVPSEAGTHLGLNVTWHNETGRDVHALYMRLVLPYTPDRPEGISMAGLPWHVDVNYHTGTTSAFDLPPGRSVRSFEFTQTIDGGLIGVGGHLHDYGRELRLEDVDGGEVLFVLRGVSDRQGHLLSVEQRVFRSWFGLKDARLRLRAGRRYRVVSEYDNPTGHTIPFGGMAHISGLFAPSDWSAWPPFDADDPGIRLDLQVLRGMVIAAGGPENHDPSHDRD